MRQETGNWLTEADQIEGILQTLHRGTAERICLSAGGRPVYRVFYGQENELKRTANYSSAAGSGDLMCFADKSKPAYRPTIFLVGAIHGGELEGTAAMMHLIQILERGVDLEGRPYPALFQSSERVNWVLIPIANPDGRARIPFTSMIGKSYYQLRYYNQGTWRDGSLCGWPECKRIHPIREAVDYLGGYYNDDGINLMHDNFFSAKSTETQAILDTAERFVPDMTVLLHGGANSTNHILRPSYGQERILERIDRLEKWLIQSCLAQGLEHRSTQERYRRGAGAFNLTSAVQHICGEACVTYESNQGLALTAEDEKLYGAAGAPLTEQEIYRHHINLFEQLYAFVMQTK